LRYFADFAVEQPGRAGDGARRVRARFFSNGAIPAIALEHPKTLSPKSIENIRGSFKGLYGGLENAHEVAVAEEGMQIKVLGTDPQKSQSIESRRFQIGEIARIYRIPLHILAIWSVRRSQISSNNRSNS
jgi:HK97 family phage portal protein